VPKESIHTIADRVYLFTDGRMTEFHEGRKKRSHYFRDGDCRCPKSITLKEPCIHQRMIDRTFGTEGADEVMELTTSSAKTLGTLQQYLNKSVKGVCRVQVVEGFRAQLVVAVMGNWVVYVESREMQENAESS